MRKTITLALSALALIAAIWSGLMAADSRYVSAQEYRKDVQEIERSLTKIQIRQLQNEAREILRESNGRPSENDQRRLNAIAQEVEELKNTATKKP